MAPEKSRLATRHYTTRHYTTLHHTSLHYTTLHSMTRHYTTLHLQLQPQLQLQRHHITLHDTTLMTLHYAGNSRSVSGSLRSNSVQNAAGKVCRTERWRVRGLSIFRATPCCLTSLSAPTRLGAFLPLPAGKPRNPRLQRLETARQ